MVESEVQNLLGKLSQLKNEIGKVIVGQEAILLLKGVRVCGRESARRGVPNVRDKRFRAHLAPLACEGAILKSFELS